MTMHPFPSETVDGPPQHGYQGDRGLAPATSAIPTHLTVAISREAGARGGTIGRRLAQRLGWAVYDQELLEYMAQDEVVFQGVLDGLSPAGLDWVESHAQHHLRQENISSAVAFQKLIRLVLALAVEGRAVLIGRGSGQILPAQSTFFARIVALPEDRIAYFSQSLRLSVEEAAERVRLRDQQRNDFIKNHFQSRPEDTHQYDLVLNSSLLGEALCVELLFQAATAIHKAGLPRRPLASG